MSAYPDMSYDTLTFTHEVVRLDDDEEVIETFKTEVTWEVEYEAPGRNSKWRFDADRYYVSGVSYIDAVRWLTESEAAELEAEVPELFKAHLESLSPY